MSKLMVQNVIDLVPESKAYNRGAGPVHLRVCCIIFLLESTSSWWCHVLLTLKIKDNKVKSITPALIVKCIYFLFIEVFSRKVLWLSLEEQVWQTLEYCQLILMLAWNCELKKTSFAIFTCIGNNVLKLFPQSFVYIIYFLLQIPFYSTP